MKRIILLALIMCASVVNVAYAADKKHVLSIAEAMQTEDFKASLNAGVKFYFGGQSFPTPVSQMGERVTNKKTNAFNKSDRQACEWVLLSALIALQDSAVAAGGNAVVNIESYYKRNVFSSEVEYECHTGTFIAGVALKGDVVRLP
ncbi:Uncharacterised protein [Zhongshania aliphaticivorans]|uniref:Excinuclease ATPase subunit n=1 Tax=Zhongshania aliphaticivorans TaxID=1470434 RepID=A0A5S9NMM1_9GAMM|nr:excinuclease ATPase subunit [Zhongshania aliphaticivorans]CAA0091544.1 Uncharacterised protein [Zhongshania aliphaticivorans]CAA0098899.1 Uncharacterised protein [Zhongshania aliphaticivorans]